VKFLRWARLLAVFTLITTNTCQQIVELILGMEAGPAVAVRLVGQRKGRYSNKVSRIEVNGICALEKRDSR